MQRSEIKVLHQPKLSEKLR